MQEENAIYLETSLYLLALRTTITTSLASIERFMSVRSYMKTDNISGRQS